MHYILDFIVSHFLKRCQSPWFISQQYLVFEPEWFYGEINQCTNFNKLSFFAFGGGFPIFSTLQK